MLLNIDGLDQPWDGIRMPKSDYEGRFGELEFDDMPLSMQRLYSPDEVRAYDTSVLAGRSMRMIEEVYGDDDCVDGIREVGKLSLNFFRQRLIEHFDIKFKAGEIIWPRSRGKQIVSSTDT